MKNWLIGVALLASAGCAWLPAEKPQEASQEELAAQRQAQLNAWLDSREALLREALLGSRMILERRGEHLVVTAPVDASFKRERVMLLPATLGPLGRVAKLVHDDPHSTLQIHSHTDASGSVALNRQLSEERAKAVAALFYLAGARSKVGLQAFGEAQPLHSNASAEGRSANRRVELWLTRRNPTLLVQQ